MLEMKDFLSIRIVTKLFNIWIWVRKRCACVYVLSHVWFFATSWNEYSPPGLYVYGIFQVRILEWVAISYSSGSFWSRDRTCISFIFWTGGQILYHCATWEALENIHFAQDVICKSRKYDYLKFVTSDLKAVSTCASTLFLITMQIH